MSALFLLTMPARRLLDEMVGAFAGMLLFCGLAGCCLELTSRVLCTGVSGDRSHQAQT
jgi:hypothetical protein